MCEIKTVLVSGCFIVLVTASFCIYRLHPEKKGDKSAKSKNKNLAKMGTKTTVSLVSAITYWKRIFQVLTVHGYLEENAVKLYVVHFGETLKVN